MPAMSNPQFDVAIVGGGPVGAALAIALRDTRLSVVVLEARTEARASNDLRTLAMSHGSRLILERLGIWSRLEPVTPIEWIHVSQQGGFGRALLRAEEAGVPALGYVVRYAQLQQAFGNALQSGNTTLTAGAEVTGMRSTDKGVCIDFLRQGAAQTINARLLVIADGGASASLRADAKIRTRDYGQHAVVGLVETSREHQRKAYERFTPEGPIALLPFENRYALVWTAPPAAAVRLETLRETDFLAQLQRQFGDRAGRFSSIEARARFPLTLRYVIDPVRSRAVMLGNAAQALHPIAGQGFNLGLRDAWELGEILQQPLAVDPGADDCLAQYRATRRGDRRHGIALTHSLVRIFSNDHAPLRATRGAALALLDVMPAVKHAFVQRMMFGASLW